MIITLAGLKGAGKSTTGKLLAERLEYEYFYMGQRFREEAQSRGMTIKEFDEYLKDHPEIDIEMDKRAYQDLEGKDDLIVDANIGAHFLPDSFKVFLTAPLDVRAQRVASAPRFAEQEMTVQQAADILTSREENVQSRLDELYGFRIYDESNYDLVIDTADKTPEEVVEYLCTQAKKAGFQL